MAEFILKVVNHSFIRNTKTNRLHSYSLMIRQQSQSCTYFTQANLNDKTKSSPVAYHNLTTKLSKTCFRHQGLLLRRDRHSVWNWQLPRFKSTTPNVVPAPPTVGKADYIPEPPSAVESVAEQFSGLVEPTLSSLGLCNYTPAGAMQKLLEMIHVTGDLPWWATLVSFAVVLRIVMVPLQIMAMKAAITNQSQMPVLNSYKETIDRANQQNDIQTAMLFQLKMEEYRKKNNPRPFRAMLPVLYQTPIFISVLAGIRGMASLPVESLTTGGLYWFTDLTAADPYMLLPALTAAALLANIELGADGIRSKNLPKSNKWMLRLGIGVGVPVFMSFAPSALGVYWFTSNLMAIGTMKLIKIPSVKQRLNMPEFVQEEKERFLRKAGGEGLLTRVTSMYKDNRIKKTMDDKENINAKAFFEAGRARKVKTYTFDPTKVAS